MKFGDYIVQIRNHTTREVLYYATDSMSGGYPYFTTSLSQASQLPLEYVEQIITDLGRPNGKDGLPNNLLHQAAKISNTVLEARITVSVGRMQFVPQDDIGSVNITAVNKSAEAKAEKDRLRQQARDKMTPEEREAFGI